MAEILTGGTRTTCRFKLRISLSLCDNSGDAFLDTTGLALGRILSSLVIVALMTVGVLLVARRDRRRRPSPSPRMR
jgi:hypothetical protein